LRSLPGRRQRVDLLRQAYPRGVPERDYLPLLVVLHEHFAEGNLAAVVAELTDGERPHRGARGQVSPRRRYGRLGTFSA
jgi:hypothetical protein